MVYFFPSWPTNSYNKKFKLRYATQTTWYLFFCIIIASIDDDEFRKHLFEKVWHESWVFAAFVFFVLLVCYKILRTLFLFLTSLMLHLFVRRIWQSRIYMWMKLSWKISLSKWIWTIKFSHRVHLKFHWSKLFIFVFFFQSIFYWSW